MLTLGEIQCKAVEFCAADASTVRYVVGLKEMAEQQGPAEIRRRPAEGLHLGDAEPKFFLVFVQDCFDPPLAIVRAETAGDAVDIFVDELPWARINPEDVDDVEDISWSDTGVAYNAELVHVQEVRLCAVYF